MARNLLETFERLKALLAAETGALRLGTFVNLASNADSKARILLELTQWRAIDKHAALSREQTSDLVVLLNDNASMLEQHMNAAKRISNSLAQHLRDADSDGTYQAGYGVNRGGYHL